MPLSIIERQKSRYGWEFIFMGANIDAVSAAKSFGISPDRAVQYKSDSKGTRLNFKVMSEAVCSFRRDEPVGAQWKEEIERDVAMRGE